MDSGILVAIFVPISMFAMIFGIFYLRTQEKMSMIERGMDPRAGQKPLNVNYMLRFGLIVIGTGVGFLIALIVNKINYEWGGLFPAFMAIFGGSGALLSYIIEKKEANKTGDN
jgi:hypothetical protein